MKTLCGTLLAVLLLAAIPSMLFAQEGEKEHVDYIAAWYGVNFGGDFFGAGAYQDFGKNNPQAFGASVAFWQDGLIGGELDFGYNQDFLGASDDQSGNDSNLLTVTGSLTINPTFKAGSQRIRPYLLAGGGLARFKFEEFAIFGKDSKNKGVLDFGGGLVYQFHPRVGVRGDFRYFYAVGQNDSEDGWGLIENWNWWRGTGGVVLTF